MGAASSSQNGCCCAAGAAEEDPHEEEDTQKRVLAARPVLASSEVNRPGRFGLSFSMLLELSQSPEVKERSDVAQLSNFLAPTFESLLCSKGIDKTEVFEKGVLPQESSFAELCWQAGMQDSNSDLAAGVPTVFVSHASSSHFCHVVDAVESWIAQVKLRRARRPSTASKASGTSATSGRSGASSDIAGELVEYFWIKCTSFDHCCVAEKKESPSNQDWSDYSLEVITRLRCTLLVVEPWFQPTFLESTWCLWELFATHVSGTRLHLTMPVEEKDAYVKSLKESYVKVEQAGTYFALGAKDSDGQHQVLEEIDRSVGLHRFTENLHTRLNLFLASCARAATSQFESPEESMKLKDHLARLLREQGNLVEAEIQFRAILADCHQLLGQHNVQALETANQLAVTLQKNRDPAKLLEAEELHRQTLTRRQSLLGESHPDTLQSLSNLATLLGATLHRQEANAQERLQEAIGLARLALSSRKQVLGQTPSTFFTAMMLGRLLTQSAESGLGAEADLEESAILLDSVVNDFAGFLGRRHPLTLSALNAQAHRTLCYLRTVAARKDPDMNITPIRRSLQDTIQQVREILQTRSQLLGAEHSDSTESRQLLRTLREFEQGLRASNKRRDRRDSGDFDNLIADMKSAWREFVPERFHEICNAAHFWELRTLLRLYGVERLKNQLIEQGYVDNSGMLTTGTKPFNVFVRIVCGALKQENMVSDQKLLGNFQSEFQVCCNRPECDEHWESFDPAWIGKASMSRNHRFMCVRSLSWMWFNVLVFGMFDNLTEAIKMLQALKDASLQYARTSEGWSDNVGLFFHVYPLCSVNSLHLHIVDLEHKGPTFNLLSRRNLPIDDVLEVLKEEQQEKQLEQ